MTNQRSNELRGGDQGERYEVRFKTNAESSEFVFGWSESFEGVQAMVDRISRHPTWHSPRVMDRLDREGKLSDGDGRL